MTVQGHCDFLRARFGAGAQLSVVVANDVRVFNDVAGTYAFLPETHPLRGLSSRGLARLACEIYAGNGITAFLPTPDRDATLATPELAFAIATLGASGGINVSASHNPPDDNGVKLYDQYGSQPVAPEDQQLLDVMAAVTAVRSLPFTDARARGLVRALPDDLHGRYLDGYVKLYGDFQSPRADLPVVYTPLCGVGDATVGALLRRVGFPVLSPPDEAPDGSFRVIPFRSPNPEVPQSTEPARAFADRHGSGIVLSSDPDADRVGLEARLEDGTWYHFDGNMIAAILAYALMLDPRGPRRTGLVIETLVTTKLVARIAEARGDCDVIDDLLVGFKYVADVLKRLRATGEFRGVRRSPDDLVLAAEESHGVIALPTILDKDSAPACLYLAGLYQRLRAEGRDLLDYYVAILEQVGGFDTINRSIMMAGPVGMARKDRIMRWLRDTPPAAIAGQRVTRVTDYWDEVAFGPIVSESERLPRNVIVLHSDRYVVAVRPSGTEPKLKFYCQLLPGPSRPASKGVALLAELRAEAETAARAIYNDLLRPLDVRLGEAALLMTDLVELDRKQEFEVEIAPALREALRARRFETLDEALAWLREASRALLPGADPLPALKAPLAALCPGWRAEAPTDAVLAALDRWARAAA
jgi:phosphoglucomutase/phosphomannomutase